MFVVLAGDAHACRSYLHNARMAIRSHVEALGSVEARLLYRLMGGRWPAYEDLSRDARAIHAIVYTHGTGMVERRLRHCRNFVPPVRRTCRDAAAKLVNLIEQSASQRLSEDTRMDYARLMARCETWLSIPRRSSLLRMP